MSQLALRPRLSAVVAAALLAGCSSSPSSDPATYVPSPDWRDQVIYFVMTDRFADGDTSNDDQGYSEFDQSDDRKYSGGDFAGLRSKLDYIQGLGATAVWVTPPVANQWWDPLANFGGYHGYWARNFELVDDHLGFLDDYKGLAIDLHKRDMYLVQDIVANHTGNFFTYDPGAYDPSDPTKGFTANTGSQPTSSPTLAPFDEDDPTVAKDLSDGIYHWTPAISDYSDPSQVLNYQLSDLDDLATENPKVRTALKNAYAFWIRGAGVDAFRVDTVLYVEHSFWNDFVHASDGILTTARVTEKDDFFTFGEAFVNSSPLDDAGDREAASYLGTADAPELDSVLNFPLYFTIRDVFAQGRPTHDLGYRLEAQQAIYPDVNRLPTFIDNHDVGRFLARSTMAKTQEALLLLLTLPGVPVIYYGTEQAMTETRGSMFAAGWGSGGVDHFGTSGAMYAFVRDAIALRRAHKALTRGSLTVLADNALGPGLFAFRRDGEGESVLGLFNSADGSVLAAVDTGLPAGSVLQVGLSPGIKDLTQLTVDADGKLTMELPAGAAVVASWTGQTATVGPAAAAITIDAPAAGSVVTSDLAASGTVTPAGEGLELVLDGYLDTGIDVTVVGTAWTATVPAWMLGQGVSTHTLSLYARAAGIASDTVTFQSNEDLPVKTVTITDPVGDDKGPSGTYVLPTNPTFESQMDITGLTVTSIGTTLEVDVSMAEVTTVWNPQNGFDHVCFSIFLQIPGQAGVAVLPKLNASAPSDLGTWSRLEFADGWYSTMTGTDGASATAYGTAINPGPSIKVTGNTVKFVFSPASLGNVPDLTGTKVYVTTWDYDGIQGVLRPLTPDGGPYTFGGGDGTVDPLVIDDTAVVTLQ